MPYLRAANVKDGRLQLDSVLEMNFSPAEQATFSLRPGDVLVTEGCGSIGQLGAAARWDGEIGGTVCFQNTLLRLRAVEGLTDPGFVEVWARHAFSSGLFAAVASGTNIFHIGSTRAKQVPLLLPPLVDQLRIVDLLGALDHQAEVLSGVKATARRTLDAARENGASLAVDRAKVGDLIQNIGTGKSPPALNRRPLPGERAVLKVSAVRRGWFDAKEAKVVMETTTLPERSRLSDGDILITRANTKELVGAACRVAVAPAGYFLCDKTLRLHPRLDLVDPDFLVHALLSRVARAQIELGATGSTASMKNISQQTIRGIEIPLPPLVEQQQQSRLFAALDILGSRAEEGSYALKSVRAALLGDLLSGNHEIPDSYDALLESAS